MSIEFVSERSFESNGVQLAAKEWGSPVGRPIIALHGWLDNANSFDRMLPHMDQVHVIAVDMAGHSQSGFRSADSGYDIWQDIADVMAIAEQMGWNRFGLLGHSRGAIVSALVAGTFPKKVTQCLLIDSYFPIPNKPANAAAQLAKAITDSKRFQTISPSAFDSFDDAVKARVNGFVALKEDASIILAQRGVVEVGGKFSWRNDQRLKATSMVSFTKEQCESFFHCHNLTLVTYLRRKRVALSADSSTASRMGTPHSSGLHAWLTSPASGRPGATGSPNCTEILYAIVRLNV